MKIEDIKKIHLKQLKNECQKLYKMKFEWADDILLEKLVENTVNDDDDKQTLHFIIEHVVPNVIDKLIDIDLRNLKIKVKKGCKNIFSCC